METTAIQTKAANGADVEVGIVTFQGRDFAALGSVVDLSHGEVCGYVKRCPVRGRYVLTTWAGECMYIELRPTATWRTPRSFVSTTMTSFKTVINGHRWTGRCGGEGMFLRLKKGASVKA